MNSLRCSALRLRTRQLPTLLTSQPPPMDGIPRLHPDRRRDRPARLGRVPARPGSERGGERRKLSEPPERRPPRPRPARRSAMSAGGLAGRASSWQQMENSGLPPNLQAMPFFQELNRSSPRRSPTSHAGPLPVGRRRAVAFLLGLTVWAVTASPVFGLIAAVVGGYGPFFVVSSRRHKRQKLLALQIPDALDFLSRVLRAGHSLTTGPADDGRGAAQADRRGVPPSATTSTASASRWRSA